MAIPALLLPKTQGIAYKYLWLEASLDESVRH
jgi:hypothetical protein